MSTDYSAELREALDRLRVSGRPATETDISELATLFEDQLRLPTHTCVHIAKLAISNPSADSSSPSASSSTPNTPQRRRGRSPAARSFFNRGYSPMNNEPSTTTERPNRGRSPFGMFRNSTGSAGSNTSATTHNAVHTSVHTNAAHRTSPPEEKKDGDADGLAEQLDRLQVHSVRGRSPSPGPDTATAQPKIPGSPRNRTPLRRPEAEDVGANSPAAPRGCSPLRSTPYVTSKKPNLGPTPYAYTPHKRPQVQSPMDVEMFDATEEFTIGTRPSLKPKAHLRRPPPESPAVATATLEPPPQVKLSPIEFKQGVAKPRVKRTLRQASQSVITQPAPEPTPDFSGRVALIQSKRDEARNLYNRGQYQESIVAYTQAVQAFDGLEQSVANCNTMALIKSNRAAALVMIGACQTAADDCVAALPLVSTARTAADPFSNDGGPPLSIRLKIRHARALLKLGAHSRARAELEEALFWATQALEASGNLHSPTQYAQVQSVLEQLTTEANIATVECSRLAECRDKLAKNTRHERWMDALANVGMSLTIATACTELQVHKVELLAKLKKWREIASYCEGIACQHVALDHAFGGDLVHPLGPGIPPAVNLKMDLFDNKLSSRCVAEAVVRLPLNLCPFYMRALRLEERYPAADAALKALEDVHSQLPWLPGERNRLNRTKSFRERGDELFRTGDYDQAAFQYLSCLRVDGGDETDNSGGRLHAVLHCNRAACLIALKLHSKALEECAAALRIHPRYMKAMLRRARCLNRLSRFEEAIATYNKYLKMVDDHRKGRDPGYVTPCVFDGPSEVKDKDLETVRKELEAVHLAKRKAEAAARDESNRQRFQQNFSAQQRREEWYNQNDRRWDSFSNRRSDSWAGSKPQPQQQRPQHRRAESWGSPGSDRSVSHYQVLGLERRCNQEDIRKAYRAMAKKYHPDKNKEEGAADTFRRVQLAYETLRDPLERSNYDATLNFGRRY